MPAHARPAATTPRAHAAAARRRAALAAVCTRFGVECVYAFGSRAQEAFAWARGELDAFQPTGSDLDIAVKLPGGGGGADLALNDKVRLAFELEDLLGLPCVDLVTFAEAGAFLALDIVRGERLFATDERAADELDLYVLRRAGDLAPFERQRRAMLLGIADEP